MTSAPTRRGGRAEMVEGAQIYVSQPELTYARLGSLGGIAGNTNMPFTRVTSLQGPVD